MLLAKGSEFLAEGLGPRKANPAYGKQQQVATWGGVHKGRMMLLISIIIQTEDQRWS